MGALFEGVLDAALGHGQAIIERLESATRHRPHDYYYGWHTLRDIYQVATSGTTMWLLHKHKRLALPFSIASTAVTAGLSAISAWRDPLPNDDGEQPKEQTIGDKVADVVSYTIPSLVGTLSLALNPDSRQLLDQPMDLAPRDPSIPFTVGEHIRNGVSLYATYTIVGHWLEMAFCQLIRLGVMGGDYDRSNAMLWDWWLHPFPAEGIAGVLIAGVLSPLREVLLKTFGGRLLPAVAVSFLANQIVCTSIDYLTGMVANRNYELWDYRNMPFNFQGQICLQNSLVYSIAATLVAWIAYPARQRWLSRLPSDVANAGFSAILPTYAYLCLLYFL